MGYGGGSGDVVCRMRIRLRSGSELESWNLGDNRTQIRWLSVSRKSVGTYSRLRRLLW